MIRIFIKVAHLIKPFFPPLLWMFLSKNELITFLEIEPFYPGMLSSLLYYLIIIRGRKWQLK